MNTVFTKNEGERSLKPPKNCAVCGKNMGEKYKKFAESQITPYQINHPYEICWICWLKSLGIPIPNVK